MNSLLPTRRRFSGWVPETFRPEFDNIWDRFFDEFDSEFGNCCYKNADEDIVYEFEVAGFNKDNIDVKISDGIMEITGKREIGEGVKTVGKKSIHQRISIGDVKDAEAVVTDGILRVTVKYQKDDVKNVKVVDVKESE